VTNADDGVPVGVNPGLACVGARSCSAEGDCLTAPGGTCRSDGDCASGHCFLPPTSSGSAEGDTAEGVCCNTACDGACDTCVATPGTCTQRTCGAYSCVLANPENGDKGCLSTCDDTSQCAAGFQCVAGACVTPPNNEPTVVACHVGSPGASSRAGLMALVLAAGLGASMWRRRAGRRTTIASC
jgi:hypothetical protein